MKIRFVNPSELFHSHGPVVRQHPLSDYYDHDEIGISTYLQVLPSIALYGFKYAVPISKSRKILDGNFRAFCAEELGIKVPVIICKNNAENRSRLNYKLLWIIRKLVGKKYLFKRKWKNPRFNKKFARVLSYCIFQKNILNEVDETPYKKQLKVLFIFDIAGVGADLADYINRNNFGVAYVVHREQFDRFYMTRSFGYNIVPRCSVKKFILIVIKQLLFFKPEIVHINAWSKAVLFTKIFAPKSKIIIQFHGTDLRGKKIPWYVKLFSNKILVSTKDLLRKKTIYMGVPLGD